MDFWAIQIPPTLAIAAIAALGYLVGRRAGKSRDELAAQSDRELRNARAVTREMEKISRSLHRSATEYHAGLSRKRARAGQLGARRQETTVAALGRVADPKLAATSWLPVEAAGACLIRQDRNHLMTIADVRTGSLTGPFGRGGPDDTPATQFAMSGTNLEQASGAATRLSNTVEETAPVMKRSRR
jgi:hypothetical protein